ncbi:uncharacterized protein LOC131329773 isoform X1 [Rhododendron vialii]|uniref:uncharacterized protein LOC131329773 isoform X1 n=1 Tax=Rhododendron vialii TaxID=182163 RepID=UPI00265FD8E8|nr:uncharacterized protein LOC131329773 isoform X1 [Rhododendron vialii]
MIPSQQNAFSGSQASTSQPHFAGFTEAYTAPSFSQIPGMVSGSSSFHVPPSVAYNEDYDLVSPQVAASSSQPWYFDSGATNHITHSIQNLAHPQPAVMNDGIMVGNGSHLQASHTDADWAGNRLDRRSTTGYCFVFGFQLSVLVC